MQMKQPTQKAIKDIAWIMADAMYDPTAPGEVINAEAKEITSKLTRSFRGLVPMTDAQMHAGEEAFINSFTL